MCRIMIPQKQEANVQRVRDTYVIWVERQIKTLKQANTDHTPTRKSNAYGTPPLLR